MAEHLQLPDGRILSHHEVGRCDSTESCCFHNPSDPIIAEWPFTDVVWVESVAIMYRTCLHGYEHPDLDSVAYAQRYGVEVADHVCDGCCVYWDVDAAQLADAIDVLAHIYGQYAEGGEHDSHDREAT